MKFRNIFSRIWQGIKDFFDRVFNAIGKFHFQSGEAQLLDKLDKRYKKLEKTFIDILRSLGTETNSAEENLSENKKEDQSAETEKSSLKYSKKDAIEKHDSPIISVDKSAQNRYNRSKKVPPTDEFATYAMQWAYSSKRRLGDIKILYNPKNNTWNKIVATDTENRYEIYTVIQDVPKNAEAIRNLFNEVYNEDNKGKRDVGESLRENYERYWNISRSGRNDDFNVEKQGANGLFSEVHGSESNSDRSSNNNESRRDSRNIKKSLKDASYI